VSEHRREGHFDDSKYDFTQTMPAIEGDSLADARKARRSRRMRTATKATLAALSAIVLVGASVYGATLATAPSDVQAQSGVHVETVARSELQSYCPERMQLADTAAYGDSQFQVSEGNISSQAVIAASGDVQLAAASSLDGITTTPLSAGAGAGALLVNSQAVDSASLLGDAFLTQATDGTGLFGTSASWATEGDLRGVAATQCVATATKQRVITPSTGSGWTEQLVLANPGSIATTVTLTAWGTSRAGSLSLATAATVTVPARGETTVSLGAAANGENALVVDIDSQAIPIAAVVRSVSADGLTPRGSDYAVATADASTQLLIPDVASLGDAQATLFSESDTTATLTWLTKDGASDATTVSLTGQQVKVADLGTVPDGAYALRVTAGEALNAQVVGTKSGDGQSDFAISDAVETSHVTGLAIPSDTRATLVLSNTSSSDQVASLSCYDASGAPLATHQVTVPANGATTVDMSTLAGGAGESSGDGTSASGDGTAADGTAQSTTPTVGAVIVSDSADASQASTPPSALGVAATLTQPDVDAASLQGMSVIAGTSLEAPSYDIESARDQRLVS